MPVKPEVQTPLSKGEREYLGRWESLDLKSMAEKRDRLAPKTNSPVEGQTLADLYTPVYQQFSSVSVRLKMIPFDIKLLRADA